MDFCTVLLPLDVEHPDATAISHARAIARHFAAEIVVTSVVPASAPLTAARRALERLAEAELQEVHVEVLALHGDPAHVLPRLAARREAKLVVIHPRAPIGSLTEAVLTAPVPVWSAARSGRLASLMVHRVDCGIDFTPHDPAVLGWAVDLATHFHAEMALVHAAPGALLYGPGGVQEQPAFKRRLVEAATERMHAIAGVPVGTAYVVGTSDEVARVMNDAIREPRAELLVIGRRPSVGMTGGSCMRISSEARCPVLSVPT